MGDAWAKELLFSSDRMDWATPQALFDAVDEEFGFVLDAAASESNAKCKLFLGEEDDALSSPSWPAIRGDAVWLNPPYGRQIGKWVERAYRESLKGLTVVVLVFVRTDTKWWQSWAMRAAEVRLIPGRVRFGGSSAGAPAPSCLLVFDEAKRSPRFLSQSLPRS